MSKRRQNGELGQKACKMEDQGEKEGKMADQGQTVDKMADQGLGSLVQVDLGHKRG